MVTRNILVKLLIVSTIILACNSQETIAFRFSHNDGRLTTHSERIHDDELELSLDAIFSTGQAYLGLNSRVSLKSIHKKTIQIDSIQSKILKYDETEEIVECEMLEGVSREEEIDYPITVAPEEYRSILVKIPDQEELEFQLGDSILLQIDVLYTIEGEQKRFSTENKKYYTKLRRDMSL